MERVRNSKNLLPAEKGTRLELAGQIPQPDSVSFACTPPLITATSQFDSCQDTPELHRSDWQTDSERGRGRQLALIAPSENRTLDMSEFRIFVVDFVLFL